MSLKYLERQIKSYILNLVKDYKVIAVIGPRQSGKTTLVKHLFQNHNYYNLEDIETHEMAQTDPKSIINQNNLPFILDEVQKTPHLFSQIQVLADDIQENGQIIITGSSNLLMQKNLSQSLAGRVAIIHLLPLTYSEIINNKVDINNINDLIFLGGYPNIVTQNISYGFSIPIPIPSSSKPYLNLKNDQKVNLFYRNYVNTYLQKDISDLLKIKDSVSFLKLTKLIGYRVGQLVKLEDLSNSLGKSHTTIRDWLDSLTLTFITFYLRPFHTNFGKRLIKTPKVFFYDTGLLNYLIGNQTIKNLGYHSLYGQILENFVIADYIKTAYNLGLEPNAYFWRNSSGIEIDLLIEQKNKLFAIEIKSAHTFKNELVKNLDYFKKLAPQAKTILVYKGEKETIINNHLIHPLTKINSLWTKILK